MGETRRERLSCQLLVFLKENERAGYQQKAGFRYACALGSVSLRSPFCGVRWLREMEVDDQYSEIGGK